ncbi:MAG TPA: excinuclease ABC subunit UvrA [Verrucomicrobiae bacterium]|nr:excinuclease ABC subunit UvrA [Verrucomicrobiae bacterium]
MSKSSARPAIRLRGVRHNNLKNFDLDLPLNELIVICGLSGSGKSSLAFDTLFAEGQRRYIETFSPYARQFLDRMDKPQVDSIEGIPPAIAIEQRNAVKTTRSTVGTMTEICDYLKLLWPHVAQLHCRQCGKPVRKDSPQAVFAACTSHPPDLGPNPNRNPNPTPPADLLITFDVPLTDKLSLSECLGLIAKQGYQRVLLSGRVLRLDEVPAALAEPHRRNGSSTPARLTVLQDRLRPTALTRARFVEACEQAYHFGKGKLAIWPVQPEGVGAPRRFSAGLHCAECDLEYREPSPALFSFNHPVGACPTCRGFGRVISIDYHLAMPDRSKTLAGGVVKPWRTGHGLQSQNDLTRMCRHFGIPMDVPFERLPKKWQRFVIEGEPDYGTDEEHEWPRAWYGVKGYFRWLESKAYKMHVRVLLSRYRAYTPCPDCHGRRFQPETLLYRLCIPSSAVRGQEPATEPGRAEPSLIPPAGLTLADFSQLPIRDALQVTKALASRLDLNANPALSLVLGEVQARLGYLHEVGLGYLTLDRPTRSLSGGETERVNLTTCLGTRLVNTLFVLDEPSVGLHPRDTERLIRVLEQLRNAGNTVVVVEHEASVLRAADQLIDLGPGHGASGGQIVFQGTYSQILACRESLTGQYLAGRAQVPVPQRRPVRLELASRVERSASGRTPSLQLSGATRHNLKDLSVEIPLQRFVCVTGVSGSGKTTLVREVLLPLLAARLKQPELEAIKASERSDTDPTDEDAPESDGPDEATLLGAEHLARVNLVDQSILGKTPRSNPAVYIGAFQDLRELFADSDAAKQRGLNASAFSFNSSQGQCERCRGAGFEKIEMQFLSDVFIRCPDCDGRRYRSHILDIKLAPPAGPRTGPASRAARLPSPTAGAAFPSPRGRGAGVRATSLPPTSHTSPRFSIADLLDATVDEVLEFLAAFTESRPAQRAAKSIKLLQEVGLGYLKIGQPINTLSGGESQRLKLVRHLAEALDCESELPTLFLFDEPTTGLHFDDVRVLLNVFQRLVDAGHTVLVIEHNLEVLKAADWLIDLGPGAGDEGGRLVATGTPEQLAACPTSFTGQALRHMLPQNSGATAWPFDSRTSESSHLRCP